MRQNPLQTQIRADAMTLGPNINVDLLHAVLDATERAHIVVDPATMLIYATRPAQNILQQQDAVMMSPAGEIRSHSRWHTLRLTGLVSSLTQSPQHFSRVERAIPFPRSTSDRLPIIIFVAAIVLPASFGIAPGKLALLTMKDPEARSEVSAIALQSTFGLTRAEARLAQALHSGAMLRECAASIGVSYSTARTQLLSIFEKTGVSRQQQLIAILDRLADA